ncbi:MAG: hypothetical protein DRP11_01080 [Candidatus Aenigmatarchaeota archaeon]|nr:MAG: hypothetical protein DRP11_01080 [Candidatus Aenigmarchaeota archaeon]
MVDIRAWIKEQLKAGYTPEELKKALKDSGWDPRLVKETLREEFKTGDKMAKKEKKEEKEMTVEERLKQMWKKDLEEQGVKEEEKEEKKPEPKPPPKEEPPPETAREVKIEADIQKKIDSLQIEVEKLKTFQESIQNLRSEFNERLQRLSEDVGEVRSLVYQRETEFKEVEMEVEKISEIVENLDPNRLLSEFRKIERDMELNEAEIERMGQALSDTISRMRKVEDIITSIGRVENLVEAGRIMNKKLAEIDEKAKKIGDLHAKIERQFIELGNRVDEIDKMKRNMEAMDDAIKSLFDITDEINKKLFGYVEKSELTSLKDEMRRIADDMERFKAEIQIQLQNLKKSISTISTPSTPSPQPSTPPNPELEKLQEQREQINLLLSTLEEEYKKNKISEEDYKRAREINLEELKNIEKKIQELKESKPEKPPQEPKPVPPESVQMPSPEKPPPAEEKTPEHVKETTQESPEKPVPREQKGRIIVEGITKPEKKPEPEKKEEPVEKPSEPEKKGVAPKPEEKKPEKPPEPEKSEEELMLEELEHLYKEGLISKEAYEHTKKKITG